MYSIIIARWVEMSSGQHSRMHLRALNTFFLRQGRRPKNSNKRDFKICSSRPSGEAKQRNHGISIKLKLTYDNALIKFQASRLWTPKSRNYLGLLGTYGPLEDEKRIAMRVSTAFTTAARLTRNHTMHRPIQGHVMCKTHQ